MMVTDIAKHLFKHMPSGKDLTIKFNEAYSGHSIVEEGEIGCKVIEKIFGSTIAGHRHQIKSLRIEAMSFRTAGVILPTILPFENLEHLKLINCKYTDRLCASITPLELCLRSFQNQRAHCGRQEGAIDAFVKSLRPLRKLRLSSGWSSKNSFGMCDWSSLIPHAHELNCLDLDDYEPIIVAFSGTGRPLLDFDRFCSRASKLQQLSIKSPDLSTRHWKDAQGLQALLVWHCRSM